MVVALQPHRQTNRKYLLTDCIIGTTMPSATSVSKLSCLPSAAVSSVDDFLATMDWIVNDYISMHAMPSPPRRPRPVARRRARRI